MERTVELELLQEVSGLFLELAHDFLDVGHREVAAPGEKTGQQQTVADGVDAARDAAAGPVHDREDAGVEARLVLGAGALEAMLDVALGLVGVERPDVAGGRDALAELLHLGALQDGAELGLADQEALQQCLVAELEVGQHAQLLERAGVAMNVDLNGGTFANRAEQFASFQSDAPSCDNCGNLTVRNGNCYLCHNCGNSMGCS